MFKLLIMKGYREKLTIRRTFQTAFRWFILSEAKTKASKRETGTARHGDEGSHIRVLGTIATMKRGLLVFWITLRVIIICNKPFKRINRNLYNALNMNLPCILNLEPWWWEFKCKEVRSNSDIPHALLLRLPTPTMPFNLGCRGVFQRIYQGTNC